MTRRLLQLAVLAAALSVAAASAHAESGLVLTPVGRLPSPERGFIVDLPQGVPSNGLQAAVRENGVAVNATLTPVASSDVTVGTVLAIDSSDSMQGAPSASALAAARTFVARRNPSAQIGVLTFNSGVDVLQPLTASSTALNDALSTPPHLAYGTHIFDALAQSLVALERAHIASGSVVLLSDGSDVGSKVSLGSVVRRANRDHVRVFTVGLRSGAFDPATLQAIARRTGGSFAVASSVRQLAAIYAALSGRLADEYLVEYRSAASPGSRVNVVVAIPGSGNATTTYVAPTPSSLAPFHRSVLSRFLLSGASVLLLGLLVGALLGWALMIALRRPPNTLVERVGAFAPLESRSRKGPPQDRQQRTRRTPGNPASAFGRWRARLATEFEIAEISISPDLFLAASAVGTVLAFVCLVLISVPLGLLAVLVPVFARAWATRKVDAVRNAFADQLPDTLQLLASALRSGHSFTGALTVVVEQSPQPSQREFRQVLTDDQLGVPVDEALRHVAVRMASRDMEQVALLGELQRVAGGNSAEVLDTVVDTIRERADLRRLARTLTAQGRMARWILTFLPLAVAAFLWLTHPELIRPLFESSIGQILLVITGLMAVAGSFSIKRIVEIKV